MEAEVRARLDAIVVEHGVAIPWAVESGSRAWGFPSPDSDYDGRFFYVRPVEDYLRPWRPRDVIETPLEGLLDVNGWDLVKAVRLATAGNATVGEWLRSPLVYRGDPAFRDELLELVDAVADRRSTVRHYLHVGRAQWTRAGADDGVNVRLKKVFYAIRPALVLAWMDQWTGTPPMNLAELVEQVSPPAAVATELDELVAAKARTRELGDATVPPAVRAFVLDRFEQARDRLDREPPAGDRSGQRAEASRRFLALARRWAPARPDAAR